MDDGLVRIQIIVVDLYQKCLNPCCSGRGSSTATITFTRTFQPGLNPCCSGRWSSTSLHLGQKLEQLPCLNPCCSGRWSSTRIAGQVETMLMGVLILVVVDDGLVHRVMRQQIWTK